MARRNRKRPKTLSALVRQIENRRSLPPQYTLEYWQAILDRLFVAERMLMAAYSFTAKEQGVSANALTFLHEPLCNLWDGVNGARALLASHIESLERKAAATRIVLPR